MAAGCRDNPIRRMGLQVEDGEDRRSDITTAYEQIEGVFLESNASVSRRRIEVAAHLLGSFGLTIDSGRCRALAREKGAFNTPVPAVPS